MLKRIRLFSKPQLWRITELTYISIQVQINSSVILANLESQVEFYWLDLGRTVLKGDIAL